MRTVEREELLQQLADLVVTTLRPHPVRIAIDGVDGAGKSTLADELGRVIAGQGRPVIRASIDGFHRPRKDRYRRGTDSPQGYYLDSFDYDALISALLAPLGPDGNRRFRRATFDYRSDAPVQAPVETAPPNAILLFDGVFLMRHELNGHWDLRIFIQAEFDEVMRRAVRRDRALFVSEATARERYEKRYFPGQRIYLQAARPLELADVVVENTKLTRPRLLIRLSPNSPTTTHHHSPNGGIPS